MLVVLLVLLAHQPAGAAVGSSAASTCPPPSCCQRRAAFLLLLLALAPAPSFTIAADDRRAHPPPLIGCFRDYDPDGQHTFANTVMYKDGAPIARARSQYPDMRGFISLEDVGTVWKYLDPMNPRNESGLRPGWEAVVTSVITAAGPLLRNGTVLGLFLGDELCCSGVPFANLTNVAAFAKRQMLQWGGGLVYTNECIRPLNDSFAGHIFHIPHIPDAYDTPALSELLDHPAITGILTELLSEPPFAGVPVQRYDGSSGPAEYSGAESSASDESLPFRCENSFVVRRSAGNVALGGTNQTVGPHPQEGPHVNRPPQHAHPLRYQHVGGRIFGGLMRVAWGKKARTGSTGV
eukprot:COSAG01_NODE_8189_length_2885_cov_3.866834_3_plen_350_part_00